jgi:hypothetical protein
VALTVDQVIENAEKNKDAAKKAQKALRDSMKDIETLTRLGLIPSNLNDRVAALMPKKRGENAETAEAE